MKSDKQLGEEIVEVEREKKRNSYMTAHGRVYTDPSFQKELDRRSYNLQKELGKRQKKQLIEKGCRPHQYS